MHCTAVGIPYTVYISAIHMIESLQETLARLPAPTEPPSLYGGNNPKLIVREAVVNTMYPLSLKTRKEKVYTHLPARSVEPAAHAETHQGPFSGRSYDVGCGPEYSIDPEDAMEMKVLQSENSGGWQTIRGFIGASLIAAVDSHFNEHTRYHTILVLPTSEYHRIPSMAKLSPAGGEIELVLTPSDSSDESVSFEDAYNPEGTIISPVYRGHIGALFSKFPSHQTSFVGLFHRPGTLRAKWAVRTEVGGEYTAVVYSVQSFNADLPKYRSNGPSLFEYWP